MSNRGNLIIISAPSGSGKTSLARGLLEELKGILFSVSYTTRRKRKGERDGIEYFFVSEETFRGMIEGRKFLEWAHVYGNYYGTSRGFVEETLSEGSDVLLDIDVQGALEVWSKVPEAITVFVMPPSFQVLEERLRKRGLDDEEVIENRLRIARREIRYHKEYQYLLINENIRQSVEELKAIVVAARCRIQNRQETAEDILKTFGKESA